MANGVVSACATILTAVHSSATISAYVTAQFGTGAKIHGYLGVDTKDLPAETNLPAVYVVPTAFGRTDEYEHDIGEISIGVVIKSASKTTVAAGYEQLDGYQKLIGLCGLVASATETAISNNMMQLSDTTIIVDFPYFKGAWSFRRPESA